MRGSVTKSGVIVLGLDNDFPVSGQASPCVFLTKPTRPPKSSNTQGPAWPYLLSDFCALYCFTPLFATESINPEELKCSGTIDRTLAIFSPGEGKKAE